MPAPATRSSEHYSFKYFWPTCHRLKIVLVHIASLPRLLSAGSDRFMRLDMLEEQMGKVIKATNDASWAHIKSSYRATLEIHTKNGRLFIVDAAYFAKVPPIGRNSYFPFKMYSMQNLALRGGGHAIQAWVDSSVGRFLDKIGNQHDVLPYFTATLRNRVGSKDIWVARINDAFLVEQLKPQRGFQVFKFFGIRLTNLLPDAREERKSSLYEMLKML